MKKILFRSKTTPFDIFDPVTFVEYDKCGSNLGNLLYQHSVYKHLSTENQEIEINNNSVDTKKIDFINQNYDHFVVPLANAFRPSFGKSLDKLTQFLKGIKIPVTIVGVGAQTDHTGNFDNLNSIKPQVKEFLSVVLDKGNSVGVRGSITQQYVESLGFIGKADIIGCPSLFTYPENIINMRKVDGLDDNLKLAINLSATGQQAAFSENLNNFEKIFSLNFNRYNDICYIPQETRSLELLTYGVNRKKGIEHAMISVSLAEKIFNENKVKFFLNSYSWFEYLSQRDFTFGTRLHGCIASLVGGTPAMLFAHDSRTLEIAEHFALPYINLNYENRTLDAKELYDLVDLNPMQNKYEDNLRIYAQFLRKNGLETIVDQKDKMKEFDANVTHEMRNLWVEPLAMTNQCIGERLHWLKNNYDLKIKDQLKKRELNSIDHSKKLRAAINKAVQVHIQNFSKINDKRLKLVLETNYIGFKNNLLFLDGIAFFEGFSCKDWEDINYELHLISGEKNIILPLAKTNKTTTTLKYALNNSTNYDKGNFCTKSHKGVDLKDINEGTYILKLKVINDFKEEIVSFNYNIDGEIVSENKRMTIFKKNDDLFLKIISNNYLVEDCISMLNKLLPPNIKTWEYKENFIANHMSLDGFTFICDINFIQEKNKVEISFFDKNINFNNLIKNFILAEELNYRLVRGKVIYETEFENDIEKISILVNSYFSYIKNNIDISEFYKKIDNINHEIIENIKKKQKKTIGFLVSDLRKWNLGDFFSLIKNNNEYEAKIILLKEKIVPDRSAQRYLEQYNYFKKIDQNLIDRESMTHKEFHNKIVNEIDVIFYQQPWDGMSYWIQKLYKKTLSCYIPYSYIIYDSSLDYSISSFHKYLWKYFSQSTEHTKTHLKYEPNHTSKISIIGYPKLDIYKQDSYMFPFYEKFGESTKKKIIYAPHHSFKGSALQIGTFEWNGELLKNLRDQENSLWCLKPHGRFRYSVISHQIMTETEIDDYLQSWEEKNSFIYDRGDYFDLFRDSDILITDCSSFLAEYFPTGKPIIWLKSANSKVEFNDFGKYISQGFYIVNNLEELKNIYKKLVLDNVDPLKDIRHEIISKVFQSEESSSEKLYNIINKYLNSEV